MEVGGERGAGVTPLPPPPLKKKIVFRVDVLQPPK